MSAELVPASAPASRQEPLSLVPAPAAEPSGLRRWIAERIYGTWFWRLTDRYTSLFWLLNRHYLIKPKYRFPTDIPALDEDAPADPRFPSVSVKSDPRWRSELGFWLGLDPSRRIPWPIRVVGRWMRRLAYRDDPTPWPEERPELADEALWQTFNQFVHLPPNPWRPEALDAHLSRLALQGMLAHQLRARAEGGYEVDLRFLGEYATRAPFERYGVRVLFDAQMRCEAVEWNGERHLPGSSGWRAACRAVESSMIAAVAIVDHGLYCHLLGAGGMMLAMHRTLPGKHPLRKLLHVFTYGTSKINELLLEFLYPEHGYFERMFAFAEGELVRIYQDHLPDYRFETFTERLDRLGTRALLGRYPWADDMLLWWNAVDRFASQVIENLCAGPEEAALVAFVEELDRLLPMTRQAEGTPLRERARRILSCLLFNCTSWHAYVGGTTYFIQAPTWVPAKVRSDRPGRFIESIADSLQKELLAIVTSIHRTPRTLDDYGHRWRKEPRIAALWDELQAELRRVQATIEQRNLEREQVFDLLLPSTVPISVAF